MREVDPLSATLDRGWDLAQKGDAHGAIACAKRALEIDPQSPEVHNLFGYSAALAGDSEDALNHYRQALALDDTYFEAMLNCAEVLMHPIGDYDEAVAMCNDALDYAETPEEIADCILLKVDALLAKGDPEAARRTMARIPSYPPGGSAYPPGGSAHPPGGSLNGDHYMFMIGRAYYELGDFEKAAPFLEEATKREPQNPDTHYYMGILRDEQGDTRAALDCFLKTRALDQSRAAPPWAPSSDAFGAMVKTAVTELDALLARHVTDAEVFVVDLPGAELIVDGVDPRALVLLDMPPTERNTRGSLARLFVYQRNVERAAGSLDFLPEQLKKALEREVEHAFDTPPLDKSQLN